MNTTVPSEPEIDLAALESTLDLCAKHALAAFGVNESELADEVLAAFVTGQACFSTSVVTWHASARRPARISVVAHFAGGDREPQPIASMTIKELTMN